MALPLAADGGGGAAGAAVAAQQLFLAVRATADRSAGYLPSARKALGGGVLPCAELLRGGRKDFEVPLVRYGQLVGSLKGTVAAELEDASSQGLCCAALWRCCRKAGQEAETELL